MFLRSQQSFIVGIVFTSMGYVRARRISARSVRAWHVLPGEVQTRKSTTCSYAPRQSSASHAKSTSSHVNTGFHTDTFCRWYVLKTSLLIFSNIACYGYSGWQIEKSGIMAAFEGHPELGGHQSSHFFCVAAGNQSMRNSSVRLFYKIHSFPGAQQFYFFLPHRWKSPLQRHEREEGERKERKRVPVPPVCSAEKRVGERWKCLHMHGLQAGAF